MEISYITQGMVNDAIREAVIDSWVPLHKIVSVILGRMLADHTTIEGPAREFVIKLLRERIHEKVAATARAMRIYADDEEVSPQLPFKGEDGEDWQCLQKLYSTNRNRVWGLVPLQKMTRAEYDAKIGSMEKNGSRLFVHAKELRKARDIYAVDAAFPAPVEDPNQPRLPGV